MVDKIQRYYSLNYEHTRLASPIQSMIQISELGHAFVRQRSTGEAAGEY